MSRYRSARWWVAPRLNFGHHKQTGNLFYKNKKILSQTQNLRVDKSPKTNDFITGCVYANTLCYEHSACMSVVFIVTIASSRPGVPMNSYVAIVVEVTSQLLTLALGERTSRRPSNETIWELRHDSGRDLTQSRWFSFVNTTWHGPGPVKSQVKKNFE